MKNFADRLNKAIDEKNSVVCVGLDPRLDMIPEFIKNNCRKENDDVWQAAAESVLEFNKGIIDAIFDLVPVIKPQIAFYEVLGSEGIRVYIETIKYAKSKGLLVIADAKRNDIDRTAEAYAQAFLGKVNLFGNEETVFDADAVTVTPYLGFDGIKPFIEQCKKFGKGIFVLVKTSNKSSGDLQDRYVQDEKMCNYELMAHFVESWGNDEIGESGYSSVGAVVGATYPEEAKKLRKLMPQSIFLVPGYGAQGGGAADCKPAFNSEKRGAIVNNSRGIIFAYKKRDDLIEKDYAKAARDAVIIMNEDLSVMF
ncbi:MAG: Orotidine 5'-phosphate decarboxylase [Candidatus Peregrinibacteria bacterium GW2011_GWA2_33_10]|nr:MAG: Orotidine 5'-phosphate decarboxylase [Candidatus Peregrinibacteria bacterium GW2011_GWA2_33_10]